MRSDFEQCGIDAVVTYFNYNNIQTIVEEDNTYSFYDMVNEYGNLIEVKNRRIDKFRYINSGLIIQKNKYDKLIQHNDSYYIQTFLFKDSTVLFIFNLSNIKEPEWGEMSMEQSDEFYSVGTINKMVGLLNINDCEYKVKYNNKNNTYTSI